MDRVRKPAGNDSQGKSVSLPPPGTIIWHEVVGADADGLRSFYGQLFGWRFTEDKPTYSMFPGPDGRPVGGIGAIGAGQSWTTFYVAVADLETAMQDASALGATVLRQVVDAGPNRFCVMADPEGHPFGLVQVSAA